MDDTALTDAIMTALVALVPVLAAILTFYLKGVLAAAEEKTKAEIGNEQFAMLLTFAGIFVRSVEQTIGIDSPEAKKQAVLELLLSVVEDAGIQIRDEQLAALIEGVYNEIKQEFERGE
jgi:LL-H family phage holin